MEELNLEPFVLNIKNGLNFRDLGGYKTKSGQVIKSRKIIRSARLSELSDDDLQYLTDYGLTTDIDFRSPEEQKWNVCQSSYEEYLTIYWDRKSVV